MGLLQKAVETYDAMAHRAGQIFEGENQPLAPISHIVAQAQIEITLDQEGRFVSARALGGNKAPKIIIPATEESAGRTRAPCAHPLCDQLGYVSPYDKKKHALYVDTLSDWANSEHTHPKLQPILAYVRGGTILTNLSSEGIIQLTPEGGPPDKKLMVCWVVNGLGEKRNGPCWEDRTLMDAFVNYIAAKQKDSPPSLCMITGSMNTPANQHPKGIVPVKGNAKLISANDFSGFTYRGRFKDAAQAATVGYVASQKAHSALRWLVANQNASSDKRIFLCWNPQGIQVPRVTGPMGRRSGTAHRAANPSQYQKQLREALSGWKEDLPQSADVVIAAFDAATEGRLAVTYYNELLASDFLDRLHDWEASCCWENGPAGIQSPSLLQIVRWAFGTPRNDKIDDHIQRQQMQRLTACRVARAPFPPDIERALVEKASHLLLYGGEDRQELLFTACAAVRKYHYDHLKEEWDMALDKDCVDRSYLFGRLLAIADAVENSAYTGEGRRETNALRMQKAFALRPMATWRLLEEKLGPYYKQLGPSLRQYYRKLTQEVVDKLSASDGNLNQKLDDVYLLGYYHQRAYRTEKVDKCEIEEES